ncbi:hypothetical protein EMCRGX_G017299 [Ephydatia muelleri]
MLSENVWLCVSIQIALFVTLQAQAPGDGSSECQNPPFTKTPFPSNIVTLMDSYDYLYLTVAVGGPWSTLDVDGDTRTWAPAGDTSCRQVTYSCSYNLATQNNWLITQHINTTVNGKALSQVVVRVNFSLNGCPPGGSCQQSFLLQMYQTRNIDPSGSINLTNYAPFSGSRVTVGSNPSGTVVETQDVTVQLGARGGLYMAAQDTASSTPVIVGVVVAVVALVGVLLFVLLLVGMLKHTSKRTKSQGDAVTLSQIDQPQSVQPTYITTSGQETATFKSTQHADTMYQPLSKELMSSPSTYAEIKHLQSTHPVQSMQHIPNADTMYQPLSKEFMSPPSTYAEMKHLQSTHPVQSMQHTPNADTMYQPLSKEFMSSPSTYAEMKHLQSTQPVQSMQHAPNADTMYLSLTN